MQARHIQWLLAFIFLGLGGWTLLFPGSVEALSLRPGHYIGTEASRVILGCFGAQAVLCGIVILVSRFTARTFLVFGVCASLPFMAFNYYFYYVREVFTDWMLLDFAGNIGIFVLGIVGRRLALREEHVDA